jgi:hypothetical protein
VEGKKKTFLNDFCEKNSKGVKLEHRVGAPFSWQPLRRKKGPLLFRD